ncbi:MAG: hypothetical protein CBC48_10135 [bacterium TMED88]|nr:hypothetical protein [Deltaproteobacteria bacterium]OUV30829.1 MAG: hypothetical protein CBC48_10135 [bacterium TMED88]
MDAVETCSSGNRRRADVLRGGQVVRREARVSILLGSMGQIRLTRTGSIPRLRSLGSRLWHGWQSTRDEPPR